MSIWFTADPHLGHGKAAELRGFRSTEEHDGTILGMIARVPHQDTLFILGDLAFGPNKEALLRALLAAAGENTVIVLGNHDRAHPMYPNSWKHLAKLRSEGAEVVTSASVNWDGNRFAVSHFPYSGDHTDEQRHERWRLRDFGHPIIHGHTHSDQRLSWSEGATEQVNVSPEAWGYQRAVNIGDIASALLHWED